MKNSFSRILLELVQFDIKKDRTTEQMSIKAFFTIDKLITTLINN